MGVGQSAVQGLTGSLLAAGAAASKIGSDISKANAAKVAETNNLQEEYLNDTDEILKNEAKGKQLQNKIDLASMDETDVGNLGKVQDIISAKEELFGQNGMFTDLDAAKKSRQNLLLRTEAIKRRQAETAARFQKLTGKEIIGIRGEK